MVKLRGHVCHKFIQNMYVNYFVPTKLNKDKNCSNG